MADITIWGGSYTDAKGVDLPKTGGGTARFMDTSPTTATASDVAEGRYFFTANGTLTLGTNPGGVAAGGVSQDSNGYLVLDDDAGGRYDPSDATATAADILSPKTAYISGGKVTGQIATKTSADLSASGDTVTVPAGYYASQVTKAVAAGSAGTPTATKGTVSNHSISVTPSVTNTDGYISGGTKTGTAVTVSASELVSGTKEITANGTGIDVTDYASVDVSVAGGGDSLKKLIDRSITSIDFPDGLTKIGDYAFAWCQYLDISSLPSTVTQIGQYAFENCSRLRSITSLPSGVTSIGNYAFEFCGNLALTSLPSGLTSLGQNAFRSCSELMLSSLPSGITTIGGSTFQNCYLVTFSSLPSGLTRIGSYAFGNCYDVTISTIPSGVTYIDSYAFYSCESITSISCSGTITTLGAGAFNGSSSYPMSITSASFPNLAVSSLGTVFGSSTAANACQQLEFADMGSTQSISSNAFANCYALKTLVLRRTGSICTLSNVSAFLNTPMRGYNSQTGTIYVPSALISTYQTATGWKTIFDAGALTFSAIEGSDYEL